MKFLGKELVLKVRSMKTNLGRCLGNKLYFSAINFNPQ